MREINMINNKLNLSCIQISIFTELSLNKSLSRKELVEKINIPRTTIHDNLIILEKKKLILKYSKRNGLRGRPIILWYIPKYISKKIRNNIIN